ncbi:MAG: CHAP domain-containing protein, partial [Thermoflexales bacterium]
MALALLLLCVAWAAPSATEAQIKYGTFEFAPAQPSPEPIAGCPLAPPKSDLDEVLRSPKALRSIAPVLRGSDWLGGGGVNVYYHPQGCADVSCSVQLSETFNTYSYQCVDLVVRLYGRIGMLNNWQLQNAYEFRDVPQRKETEFSHLRFYPNGESTRGPAPGDILVFGATSDNSAGHVAVVDGVLGDYLTFVQQNMYNACREAQPYGGAFVDQDNGGRFSVKPIGAQDVSYPPLLGWLSTPCMKRLVDSWPANMQHPLNGLSWNRDQSGVYVYLSPERTRQLSRSSSNAAEAIAAELRRNGALSFTDSAYAECVIREVASWLREDAR